jgi:mxaL protein
MNKVLSYLRNRRDATLLASAFVLLIAARFKPVLPLPRNIYSYLLVADISQSMNVVDTTLNGKPTSTHSIYTIYVASHCCQYALWNAGKYWFVRWCERCAALYNPIEVCNNYASDSRYDRSSRLANSLVRQ